jgi:hypothetical protein
MTEAGRRSLTGVWLGPIIATMDAPDDFGASELLAAAVGGVARRRADRRFTEAGIVSCSLKVIGGSQDGLSSRWQQGTAAVSSARIDFRRSWRSRAFGKCPPIEVMAVCGPVRLPSADEVLKVRGEIIQIQTPTATLEWSVHSRYRSAAIAQLKVGYCEPSGEI